jgi:hypothetical protein
MSDAPQQYRLAYLGNFKPPFATENDYRRAWQTNGHNVRLYQEGDPIILEGLIEELSDYDLVLWTRTPDLAAKNGDKQWKLLAEARRKGVPVIGLHLDRWWGLDRQYMIAEDPFFRVDLLLTADGGHQKWWEEAGINHEWVPPAVSEDWCQPGEFREEYASEIAFVGGWQGGYHKEAKHRHELVNFLDKTYGDRVRFWPRRGEHAIRGTELTDLYWSTKAVVGDSCLVPKQDGTPMSHYCSDRIPETLGRGGILMHPYVEGIDELFEKYLPWSLGDWDELREGIDIILEVWDKDSWTCSDGKVDTYRREQIEWVKQNHTYEVRVPQILSLLTNRGIL